MSILDRKKAGAHLAKKESAEEKSSKETKEPKEKKAPKEKKKRTPKEKIKLALTIVLIVLTVLAALIVIAYAVYRSWAKPPELPASDPPSLSGDGLGGDTVVNPGTPGDVEIATGERKDDFYTFLVIGKDTAGGGNTDTILLASYDVGNQKLNVMSIPRDTMVNIPYDIKRINSVYNHGGGGEAGIRALYTEVSHLVGFVPDFYVTVEWKAIGQMVNAIGGVYFDVPWNMNYDDPYQDLHIHVNKGYQKLNGEQAMGVVRWRQNNDGSHSAQGDIGRIQIQQSFLKAVIVQCLKLENVTKVGQFAQIFTENVQTDLSLGNLAWFGEQAIFGGLTMDNVNFVTMPGNYNNAAWSRIYKNKQSYVTPYGDEILEMVNEYFNPYLEDRTASMQDIMSINKDGTLSSSTGVVKDTWAATNGGSSTSASTTPSPDPAVTRNPNSTQTPGTSPEPHETGEPNTSRPPEPSEGPNDPENSSPPEETPPSEPTGEGGTSTPGGQDEPPAAQDPIPTPTTWTPPAPADNED